VLARRNSRAAERPVKPMKALLIACLLLCPGRASVAEPGEMVYSYNMASLSLSSVPRLDILKLEFLLPESKIGFGVSAVTLRYGKWEYSVRETTLDNGWRVTGQSSYYKKPDYLIDYLPLSVFYSPVTWRGKGMEEGGVRFVYEYSTSLLLKDQNDVSVTCVGNPTGMGKRSVHDLGLVVDSGGFLRLKAGHVSIHRGESYCGDGNADKTYVFGSLNVSKWYAGIEFLFGGVSKNSDMSIIGGFNHGVKFGAEEKIVVPPREIPDERGAALAMAKPARLKVLDISFKDTGNKQGLTGGDSAVISMKVKNSGGLAGNLQAFVECKAPNITVPPMFTFGDLDTGEAKTLEIPVMSNYNLNDGTGTVIIEFAEDNGNPPDPVVVNFNTFALVPPKFRIYGISIDDGSYKGPERLAFGNGNRVLEPGESAEVSVVLKNDGGDARAVLAELVTGDDEDEIRLLADDKIGEVYEIGALESGDWRELKFAVTVSKLYRAAKKYPFTLKISEQRERFGKSLELPIAVNESLPLALRVNIAPAVNGKKKFNTAPTFGDELLVIPENSPPANPGGVAVVIGVKSYASKYVPSVEYALNDAELVREYLIQTMGYLEGNIIYLENPTKADLEKVFGNKDNYKGQLYDYIKKGQSEVFVYYTGHGAPDLDSKEGYFVPSDSDPNYVKFSGYPLSVFYENLSRVPARDMTVVIDACFSGMSDKGSIISKASPLRVIPILPGAGKINIFTSSKAEQVSSWYPDKRHSLFTYFFLKGLQSAADKNGDRTLTYGELYDYISENVPYYARRLYGRTQTPSFSGKEDKVILKY